MNSELEAREQLAKPINLKSLPPNEARVEVAKDVLAMLTAQRMTAGGGMYFMARLANPTSASFVELRDVLPDVHCRVCAIGAAFAAVVARDNAFKVYVDVDYSRDLIVDREDAVRRLDGLFSERQLALIETAFEGYCVSSDVKDSVGRQYIACTAFHNAHDSARKRMIAIMRNIIANNGEFCPEKSADPTGK